MHRLAYSWNKWRNQRKLPRTLAVFLWKPPMCTSTWAEHLLQALLLCSIAHCWGEGHCGWRTCTIVGNRTGYDLAQPLHGWGRVGGIRSSLEFDWYQEHPSECLAHAKHPLWDPSSQNCSHLGKGEILGGGENTLIKNRSSLDMTLKVSATPI